MTTQARWRNYFEVPPTMKNTKNIREYVTKKAKTYRVSLHPNWIARKGGSKEAVTKATEKFSEVARMFDLATQNLDAANAWAAMSRGEKLKATMNGYKGRTRTALQSVLSRTQTALNKPRRRIVDLLHRVPTPAATSAANRAANSGNAGRNSGRRNANAPGRRNANAPGNISTSKNIVPWSPPNNATRMRTAYSRGYAQGKQNAVRELNRSLRGSQGRDYGLHLRRKWMDGKTRAWLQTIGFVLRDISGRPSSLPR